MFYVACLSVDPFAVSASGPSFAIVGPSLSTVPVGPPGCCEQKT